MVVRTPNGTVCPLVRWCGHCTWLFAHRTSGGTTARGYSPTKQVVWPPNELFTHRTCGAVTAPCTKRVVWTMNWWCTGLFAHRMGGPVTTWGCLPIEQVVLTPNGTFAHQTGNADTKRDYSLVVQSLHVHITWLFANCITHRWCGHRTGLFAHRTDGAIAAHCCLPTVVQIPNR